VKIIPGDQLSPEWFEARCGVPGASSFDKIITSKGDPSAQAYKLMLKFAVERVSGKSEESFTSFSMQRGIELEAEARGAYELIMDSKVDCVGFCVADGEYLYGCSPDGLVGEDGGIEIKCPSAAVHAEYLLANKLPTEYFQQVQGSLHVTKRKWWDFVSYYPSVRPLIVRVYPDLEFHKKLETEMKKFCIELDKTINKIIGKG